jgi:hypothetical protein
MMFMYIEIGRGVLNYYTYSFVRPLQTALLYVLIASHTFQIGIIVLKHIYLI